MWLLLGKVAGQAEIRYPDVAVLVEQYVGGLEVPINDVAPVHVLEAKYHLSRVELHLGLVEDAVLAEMIVKIAAVHQVEDEAELVGRVEGVRHAHDERAVDL